MRKLQNPDGRLTIQRFADFGGSVHCLHSRDLWIPYPRQIGEDVFVDACILEACGGKALLTDAVYQAALHAESLCATTSQSNFSASYRKFMDTNSNAVTTIFAAKMRLGELYERSQEKALTCASTNSLMCSTTKTWICHLRNLSYRAQARLPPPLHNIDATLFHTRPLDRPGCLLYKKSPSSFPPAFRKRLTRRVWRLAKESEQTTLNFSPNRP